MSVENVLKEIANLNFAELDTVAEAMRRRRKTLV